MPDYYRDSAVCETTEPDDRFHWRQPYMKVRVLVSARMTACATILRGADIQKEQLLSPGGSTSLGIELG